MTSRPIRLLCVDDHAIVREGIALIIGKQHDMEVVATAASGQEAVQMFNRHHPDITLMDLRLGEMGGVSAIRAIRREHDQARIIVLTVCQGDEDIYLALEAGAVTYLLKDTLADDLIRIVREVHGGAKPHMPTELQARLSERAARPLLTPRERQVLELLSQGMRNREIADALRISEDTAQVHVHNILEKLGAKDRTAAVRIAAGRGLIHI